MEISKEISDIGLTSPFRGTTLRDMTNTPTTQSHYPIGSKGWFQDHDVSFLRGIKDEIIRLEGLLESDPSPMNRRFHQKALSEQIHLAELVKIRIVTRHQECEGGNS